MSISVSSSVPAASLPEASSSGSAPVVGSSAGEFLPDQIYDGFKNINSCAKTLKIELNKVIGDLEETGPAETASKALTKAAEQFKTMLYQVNEIGLNEVLQQRKISFPVVHLLVELVSLPQIQCEDALKREMSKTLCVVAELAVFQFVLQGRRVYRETVDTIRGNLRKVIDTLPLKEVHARHDLRRTKSAVKKLNIGIGTWKEFGRDTAKDFAGSLLEVAFSASLSGASLTPLAPTIIRAVKGFYNALEDSWYKDVWFLNWQQLKITSEDQFSAIKEKLKTLAQKNHQFAFCLSQLLYDLVRSSEILPEFKDKLIFGPWVEKKGKQVRGDDVSLRVLAKIKGSVKIPLKKESFWDTRYATLTYLKDLILIDSQKYGQLITTILPISYGENEEVEVRELACESVAELCSKFPEIARSVQEFSGEREASKSRREAADKLLAEAERTGGTLEAVNAKLKQQRSGRSTVSSSIQEQSVGTSSDAASSPPVQVDQPLSLEEQKEKLMQLQAQIEVNRRLEEAISTGNWDILRLPLI